LAALAGAGAVATLGGGLVWWKRRPGPPLTPRERLDERLTEALVFLGDGKPAAYADAATAAIREYLAAVFEVSAEQLTTAELRPAMAGVLAPEVVDGLCAFFDRCDALRFAGNAEVILDHDQPWFAQLLDTTTQEPAADEGGQTAVAK